MDDLVFTDTTGKNTTTSLLIADSFKKRHGDILRAIKQSEFSNEFNERNFALVEYTDKKGEKRPMYHITKDGFVSLVMGFKGKKAAEFKEKYINEFNKKDKIISDQQKELIDLKQRVIDNQQKGIDELIEERDRGKWWLND